MREVHKTYMAELEIEVLREKNKKLKQEINQLKDLLDKHLNIKTIRMDKEQQKSNEQYARESIKPLYAFIILCVAFIITAILQNI